MTAEQLKNDYDTGSDKSEEALYGSLPYRVVSTPYTGENKARGVIAAHQLRPGQLVELAHAIAVPKTEYDQHLRQTIFEHYLFKAKDGGMLLALGVGSLFNHSRRPNVNYIVSASELMIRYYAARDILPGEELTIYYGNKLWFEDMSANASAVASDKSQEQEDETAFLAGFELESSNCLELDDDTPR